MGYAPCVCQGWYAEVWRMTDSRWGLLFRLRYYEGAHIVYYVKCTRTFKRHVKAAGFVHAASGP